MRTDSFNMEKQPLAQCRECKKPVSRQAFSCPHCGAPYPAKAKWDGWGYEYKSKTTIF
jgi:Zn finger protein HypA/HybF involved in hydrogenase expression